MKKGGALKEVNERQRIFYEVPQKNLATRIWSYFRNGIFNKMRKDIGVQDTIYSRHINWFGDLSQKKVLDLGCYNGNYLSIHLAKRAKEYIGIDLSESAINRLNQRLMEFPTAKAIAVDFLSEEFKAKDFDLIYAYGVLHHFQDTDLIIEKLNEKLGPRGQLISTDPLQTSLPVKLIRGFYRPFQSDKEWEWPFSRRTFYKYQKAFHIKERRAVLGRSKWYFLLKFLPLSNQKKLDWGRRWHQQDWERSKVSDKDMFQGMHLTLWMQKKE